MPKPRITYPIGSISSGTMLHEDLIPEFCNQLEYQAKKAGILPAKARKAHLKLVREIERRIIDEREFEDSDLGMGGEADDDLESLFDALGEYAGPYFYFGAHPGDGADYGYWLSESWDEDFIAPCCKGSNHRQEYNGRSLKVSDLSDVPKWFRGEVAVVNDHGNVTLYVKTARTLREIWSVV